MILKNVEEEFGIIREIAHAAGSDLVRARVYIQSCNVDVDVTFCHLDEEYRSAYEEMLNTTDLDDDIVFCDYYDLRQRTERGLNGIHSLQGSDKEAYRIACDQIMAYCRSVYDKGCTD